MIGVCGFITYITKLQLLLRIENVLVRSCKTVRLLDRTVCRELSENSRVQDLRTPLRLDIQHPNPEAIFHITNWSGEFVGPWTTVDVLENKVASAFQKLKL